MRYLTAGESHGPQLMVIVDGVPSHLPITAELINLQLRRRQQGYGRSHRMKIEEDQVQFYSGVQEGYTTGAPVGMVIENRDHTHWKKVWRTEPQASPPRRPLYTPRPGHADLAGGMKYQHRNLRNVVERSSARETAVRVAAGAVARLLLAQCGITAVGHVVQIGTVKAQTCPTDWQALESAAEASAVRCADPEASLAMQGAIDQAQAQRDTLGGILEICVRGVPVGLGSCMQWDRKLEAQIARAVMSVQAIKGIEFGMGFGMASQSGSAVHDPIAWSQETGFYRESNHAGGFEGGMSTGERLVVRAVMKPLPTLYRPLPSVDVRTKQAQEADRERSDICAVPAAAVVVEHVVLWEVACACLTKFPADTLQELRAHMEAYRAQVQAW